MGDHESKSDLRRRIAKLEEELESKTRRLRIREKEMTCLYNISRLRENSGLSLELIIEKMVEMIPSIFQDPEKICTKIMIGTQEFTTDNYVPTRRHLSHMIESYGDIAGGLEIHYIGDLQDPQIPPFLKEEKFLIKVIAEWLGKTIENRRTQNELADYRDLLKELVAVRSEELSRTNEELQLQILERSIAQDELMRTQALLSAAIAQSPAAVIIARASDGLFQTINSAARKILKLESREDILVGDCLKFWTWKYPNGALYRIEDLPLSQAILYRKVIKDEELILELPDGETKWLMANAAPVYDEDDALISAIFVFYDITGNKYNEQKIQSALDEKVTLLREIHHRVKNNMQVISSLLEFQCDYVKDDHTIKALKESQNRIHSMVLVHEKLYRSHDFNNVDFKEYIDDLTEILYKSYEVADSRIDIIKDIADISIGIDTAVPCGLILNELVSNCLKHAFPDGRHGRIRVSLRRVDSGEIELIVSDNGIGIDEAIDLENLPSLGFELVTGLVGHQLDGTLQLERSGGTTIRVIF